MILSFVQTHIRFHTGFLAWGGGFIDASTKGGNVRDHCTDFSIIKFFSKILWGGGGIPVSPTLYETLHIVHAHVYVHRPSVVTPNRYRHWKFNY